jgi:hypothetical protein
MSHIPAVVAQIARAAREAAETFGNFPGTHAMSLCSPPNPNRVPLSLRPSHELRARAAELSRMAAMARAADTKTALETLATRFATLAAKRDLAEALDAKDVDAHEQ